MHIIRLASPTDAVAMLDIYAPYVEDISFTFETEIPSIAAFKNRISGYLQQCPWLVCENVGEIIGYAYANMYRERKGYQWSVECSVYVANNYKRQGVAKDLYSALFKILKFQQFRNVYAVINLPNNASVTFHESLGFNHIATFEKVGYKLSQWKNVGWWGLLLNEFDIPPSEPIPFDKLSAHNIQSVLSK